MNHFKGMGFDHRFDAVRCAYYLDDNQFNK